MPDDNGAHMSQIKTKYLADLAVTNAKIANSTIDLTAKVTNALPIANAGTNITSYAAGDILYASATNVLSKLSIGSSNQLLTVSGGLPTWSTVSTGVASLSAVGSSPNANAATITGSTLNLQPADGSNPGVLTAIAQTIGGVKTFSSTPVMNALSLAGTGSGTITIQPQSAAGTYNFNLPTTAGSSGQVLTSGGGGATAMTWTSSLTNPMTTAGDMIYGGASGASTRMANGTPGQVPVSSGSAVAFATLPGNTTALKAPTLQKFLSTGTTTGYLFTISTSTTCAVNDTYTNNGNTYTVLGDLSAQSGQVLFMSGANAPTASGTLTRSSGAGTSSVTFTSNLALATYTTPTSPSPIALRVVMVGGGGGGAGSGTGAPGGGKSGNPTTFGANILFAKGGSGSANYVGGSGGTGTLGSAVGLAITGGAGTSGNYNNGNIAASLAGGAGAAGPHGGAGAGGTASPGTAASSNSGAGGGGGGTSNGSGANDQGGGGGGAGAYIDALITSPSATYYYTVGGGGSGGTAGTSGASGGAGGSGVIVVYEQYQ
jgi:hypothetical protein